MEDRNQGDQEYQTTETGPIPLQPRGNLSAWRPPKPTECICDGSGRYLPDWPAGHEYEGDTELCLCTLERKRKERESRALRLAPLARIPHRYLGASLMGMDIKHPDTLAMVEVALRYLTMHLQEFGEEPESLDSYRDSAEQMERDDYSFPPEMLALFGGYGSGKSTVAIALVRGFVSQGVPARYAYVPDLLDEMRASYRNKDEDEGFYELIEKLKTVSMLALDDLGTEKATDWADEQLDKIIDYRYRECKTTVITTNMNITDLPPRIADRLRDPAACQCVVSTAPSYRPKNKR